MATGGTSIDSEPADESDPAVTSLADVTAQDRTAWEDSMLVVCDGVSRTFGTGEQAVVAVHSASCHIHATDRVAIMGPSGSGKSTLLHVIAGLDTPTSGSVTWPALGLSAAGLPGSIAMVFQGASLMPPLTVLENVAFPLLLEGMSDSLARQSAAGALASLDIGELGSRLPEELSGGQAQRACVARVLASRPRLIVADEPTGQLDHAAARHVVEVLVDAADALGAGLVVSSHDPLIASHLVSRWRMSDGELDTRDVDSPALDSKGRA
jgi:ABC-type lipoprotein export system ATPase subunit